MDIKERFFKKTRLTPNCWIWTGSLDIYGYGQIGHKYKTVKTHRMIWEIYNGKIPEGLCVCHRCDNPSCVNPKHLFLGTQQDNVSDCVKKGRHKNPIYHGEQHPMYKKARL